MEKRKVLILFIMVVIYVFLCGSIKVNCAESTNDDNKISKEDIEQIEKAYGESEKSLDKLYTYINKIKSSNEVLNELTPEEYIKNYIINGKGKDTGSIFINAIVSLIFKEVAVVLKFGISIIAISILCSLLKNLQDAFSSKGVSEIAFYACYTVIIIVITKSFLVSIQVAKGVMDDISNFMNALLPVLVSMTALSGGVIEAASLDPVIMSIVIIIPKIYKDIIIPLILITFVLQFVNNLSSEQKISNLCKLIKKITMCLQGFVVTVSIAILSIRGLTSNTLDAVTLKTTKFAVDNFIPIVGKSFSDAITSVASYSLVIKNAVSALGLLVIVLIILYPVIKIVLMIFIYKFSASVVEPISDKRIVNAISGTGESMVVLLSAVLTLSLMFFILIGVMASSGRFIVGG